MPEKLKRKRQAVKVREAVPFRVDRSLRTHVAALLASSEAHLNFDDAIGGIAPEHRGARPPGATHSAWQLLEHLRICQWDILEFSRDPGHVSPAWPAGYWPSTEGPPSTKAWQKSVAAFRAGLRAMQELVADPGRDLFARVDHPDAEAKHTLLREALLLADHSAYHIGQLVQLRRLLDAR